MLVKAPVGLCGPDCPAVEEVGSVLAGGPRLGADAAMYWIELGFNVADGFTQPSVLDAFMACFALFTSYTTRND